jgi:hypothetical protein
MCEIIVFRHLLFGRAIPQTVAGFPLRRPGFEPRSGHWGFMVDKAAMVQVFSEYIGFSCQFSFHRMLHIHHLSSGAGTIGRRMADVPSGLSLTPPQETKKKTAIDFAIDDVRVKRHLWHENWGTTY